MIDGFISGGYVPRKTEPSPWKPWFAWRPVTIHGKWVWLRKIYRRNHDAYVVNGKLTRQEYGTLFDVIKGED
jgi:hypothetical protein